MTGTLRAEVPAGKFDVFRVRCLSGVRPETVYERVWYFAPEIGHTVFHFTRRDGKTLWRTELVAHVPDLERFDARARAAVNRTFQDALEKNLSGREKVAMLTGGAPNAAVTPLATFRNGDGWFCRTYRLALDDGPQEHRYPGMGLPFPARASGVFPDRGFFRRAVQPRPFWRRVIIQPAVAMHRATTTTKRVARGR